MAHGGEIPLAAGSDSGGFPNGLSSAEAALRLSQNGPHELPRAKATPLWRSLSEQLCNQFTNIFSLQVVEAASGVTSGVASEFKEKAQELKDRAKEVTQQVSDSTLCCKRRRRDEMCCRRR